MPAVEGQRKVVLAIESSGPGGAEHMVLRLAAALRACGDAPVIATQRRAWMTERADAAGLPVWLVPQRQGFDPLWIPRFALRLRRERVALVHTHEFTMNAYAGAAARLVGIPALATVHGHHYATARGRRVAAYRWLHRLGMPLVAVSSELGDFLAQGLALPRSAIQVIANGIPLPAARPDAAGRAAARAAAGLPGDGPLVLAVGNLYPVKDHATLVRAAATLPGVRVAIAGRGEEEARLRALAAELGVADRLHLLGLRDDVEILLRAADVFAQPSRAEGLPLALLEAMGAGVPVVVSRVGGMAEVVREGESGWRIEPGDARGLAAALQRVLSSPEQAARLGAAGRARVEAEYSVERMTACYRSVYAALEKPARSVRPAPEAA